MDAPVGYRVYYSDGSVSDSQKQPWEEMPIDNVQVVVLFSANTWEGGNYCTLLHSHDWYWNWGQTNRPAEVPIGAVAKRGRWLPKEEWLAVYERAYKDTRWP